MKQGRQAAPRHHSEDRSDEGVDKQELAERFLQLTSHISHTSLLPKTAKADVIPFLPDTDTHPSTPGIPDPPQNTKKPNGGDGTEANHTVLAVSCLLPLLPRRFPPERERVIILDHFVDGIFYTEENTSCLPYPPAPCGHNGCQESFLFLSTAEAFLLNTHSVSDTKGVIMQTLNSQSPSSQRCSNPEAAR